jgi:single-strand DNA-binding protein
LNLIFIAMSFNKVMLIGNVGKDPEVRHLDSGVATTTITMATSETYTDKTTGQKITNTEWHNVVLWRGLADIAERYVRKGSQLFVEGKLRTRSWEDKEGQKRYTTEVIADNIRLLGKRDDNPAAQQGGGYGNNYAPANNNYGSNYSPASSQPPSAGEQKSGEEVDDLPF